MYRCLIPLAVALLVVSPVSAGGISGKYVEARTCDVWVAPCFANAEMNLAGKQAVMGWKVDKGELEGVNLTGLSVVAVVKASDTLGLAQTSASKAILIVDAKATKVQRDALIRFAKNQGGDLVKNVVDVKESDIDLELGNCKEGGCASMKAGNLAKIETRCIDKKHDKSCGNESSFYPPLSKNVQARTAVAEHSFTGKGLNETWKESNRRGAYVGTFDVR